MQQNYEAISVDDAFKLLSERKYAKTVKLCDRILEIMPENATAICVRAIANWRSYGDVEMCVLEVRRALEIAPESNVARDYLAELLVSMGKNQEAEILLREALEIAPNDRRSFSSLVDIVRFDKVDDVVSRFEKQLESDELDNPSKISIAFSLAKVFDDVKEPEKSIKYCNIANLASDRTFDYVAHRKRFQDLQELQKVGLDDATDSGRLDRPPVFIVGMPRSGTTLAETILSRHPDMFAAGELSVGAGIERAVMGWAQRDLAFQGGVHTVLNHVPADVWQQNVAQVERFVKARAVGNGPGFQVNRFSDKMPANALRLPLLSRLYPTAPIVYMHRHPLDTCLSNYSKNFGSGLGYSFRQNWLGQYFRDVAETVELSRELIPNPVLTLSYERLVANPEVEVRRLIEFCGLEWDEACLTPEQSDRATVMTASKWQVRQPIYKRAAGKWVRYEPYIGEIVEAMGGMEWIEEYMAKADL